MATTPYEDVLHDARQLAPGDMDRLIADLQEARDQAADDARWDTAFARSTDKLEAVAARVRTHRAAGLHIPLDADAR